MNEDDIQVSSLLLQIKQRCASYHVEFRLAPGVRVPGFLAGRTKVLFRYGRGLGVPTHERIEQDAEGRLGLRCTLLFGTDSFDTFVPCDAIDMIAGDTGPMHGSEIVAYWERPGADVSGTAPTVPAPAPAPTEPSGVHRRPNHLTLIRGGKS